MRIIMAKPAVAQPQKKYTPNMVENHAGESDMIQSKAAKVMVRPKRIAVGAENFCMRELMARSPDSS